MHFLHCVVFVSDIIAIPVYIKRCGSKLTFNPCFGKKYVLNAELLAWPLVTLLTCQMYMLSFWLVSDITFFSYYEHRYLLNDHFEYITSKTIRFCSVVRTHSPCVAFFKTIFCEWFWTLCIQTFIQTLSMYNINGTFVTGVI